MILKSHRFLLLNADLGEGGAFDADIMPLIDAASIACGGHAGNKDSMMASVQLAQQQGVIIGAHPSYDDKANFGRVSQLSHLSIDQITQQIIQQVLALHEVCEQLNATLSYIKPHGALYHDIAQNNALAQSLFLALNAIWPELHWIGLAKSEGLNSLKKMGAETLPEAFVDRRYLDNGQLVPRERGDLDPVIHSPEECLRQAKALAEGKVRSINGRTIDLMAKTLCLHGDNQYALDIARQVRGQIPKKPSIYQKDK